MRRILLDTNVYGQLVEKADTAWLFDGVKRHGVIVCGSAIIRQELRDIPKKVRKGNAGFRKLCLELYDTLVDDKRNYNLNEIIRAISMEYNNNYIGLYSWSELEHDFLIIASASLHGVDIAVSNDEKTMISQDAIQAYRIVNKKFELRTPKFIKLEELRQLLR
ncbi:MAG TPA: hypothetical protein VJH23_03190 [archaeon]|nr:hypothetical protein [archaeon]